MLLLESNPGPSEAIVHLHLLLLKSILFWPSFTSRIFIIICCKYFSLGCFNSLLWTVPFISGWLSFESAVHAVIGISLWIADFFFFFESDCRWSCIAVVLGLSVSHLYWINIIIQVTGLSFVQFKVVVMIFSSLPLSCRIFTLLAGIQLSSLLYSSFSWGR